MVAKKIVDFIRRLYDPSETNKEIVLHEPRFGELEKKFLSDCIDSTFVSSVGQYVGELEKKISHFTGIKYAVATVNGTAALHISLKLSNVERDDEVLTQSLTFIATTNAINYIGAFPIFIDSSKKNLGMCPEKLEEFLTNNTYLDSNNFLINKTTKRKIKACVPMHVFGHPVEIEKIKSICEKFQIALVEDSAEALGTFYKGKHVGHHGQISVLSFNGNKIITSGGGGMILTNDEKIAKLAKHLTTTAKVSHPWSFVHDMVGYNYRMPNLNAALACAQFEKLNSYIENKRSTAEIYKKFFQEMDIPFLSEEPEVQSNYWLNTIFLKNIEERNAFLKYSHENKVFCRPAWTLMNKLEMYEGCQSTNLEHAIHYENTLVNIPSSVRGDL